MYNKSLNFNIRFLMYVISPNSQTFLPYSRALIYQIFTFFCLVKKTKKKNSALDLLCVLLLFSCIPIAAAACYMLTHEKFIQPTITQQKEKKNSKPNPTHNVQNIEKKNFFSIVSFFPCVI